MERNLPKNPYPGLRPFEYAENRFFFGREGQSKEVLLRLQQSHFLAVVGTSGSGKSSLVRAGLLPMLHGGDMADAGARWRIAIFRPGDNPIHNLATALIKPPDFVALGSTTVDDSGKEEENLKIAVTETILRRSAVGLRDYAKSGEFAANENLIVIVDQFEEIFRFKKEGQIQNGAEKSAVQNKAENEAAAFVKLLLEATADVNNRIYIVITMRSDFLGNCAEFYNLPEAINKGQYLIPRLTRNQLRQVIESPAKVQEVEMSSALVTRLLSEIGDNQDQLPVLQHALMRTWDEWKKEENPTAEISLTHYTKTNGMDGALSKHANEAFFELSDTQTLIPEEQTLIPEEIISIGMEDKHLEAPESTSSGKPKELSRKQKIAVKLFKCLTETDREKRKTRRASSLRQICVIADAGIDEVIPVIDVFRREGRTFLMPPSEVELNESSLIDISHESLIRWDKLTKWVEEEAQDAQTYRRFAEAALSNKQKGKNGDRLLSAVELIDAIDWKERFKPSETWARLYYKIWDMRYLSSFDETIKFIQDSKEFRERKTAEEIKQQEEIRDEISKKKLELEQASAQEKISTGEQEPETLDTYYISQARDILRGKIASPSEILTLARKLKSIKAFNYARRLLARASDDFLLRQDTYLRLRIHQEWALCTYKDSDLPADIRLDLALSILYEVEDLTTTKNQETLGLVGAIYKRKWEVDNQKLQLERSLLYYRRGYREGAANDQGYTGINAAFILDLLARQEEDEALRANIASTTAQERQNEAYRIRRDIIETVAPLADDSETNWLAGMWWFYSTIAEAYFGLKEYKTAVEWLRRGKEKVEIIPDWEMEATMRQLVRIANLQTDSNLSGAEFQNTPSWQAIMEFFDADYEAFRAAFIGKIGLGLSGGGFRASLFHIGTLAKLAELGVLRHIEVLSCVSGGSIIGAHYYLEVRKLLQSKPDKEITDKDYINIVKKIEKDFLEGVKQNIRMRVAAEIKTNVKMVLLSDYSRSTRVAELYESEIFSRVDDGGGQDWRYMDELNTLPAGESNNFNPKLHNWRRATKVPILILNATTLNTGHNWQFTTTWMGEPPSSIATEVDTNDQLRRMYYTETPDEYREEKRIRLGDAVAASACVPGLFDPVALDNLYPDRIVQLVDGGVCDNQGLSSLLEQECTVILISDGSGQMASENMPSNGVVGVPLRSNSILQARIRDTQYHDLERRKRSSLLRGLMFIHLKQDLDTDPVDWIDCADPFANSIDMRAGSRQGILTSYGISKETQKRLAAVRTDLDSFSDVEAYALMTSAYRMTENAFRHLKCVEGFADTVEEADWNFLEIEEGMRGTGKKYQHIQKLLGVSNSLPLKIWKLWWMFWRQRWYLKLAAFLLSLVISSLIVAAVVLPVQMFISYLSVSPIAEKVVKGVLLGAAVLLGLYIIGGVIQVFRRKKSPSQIIIGIFLSLFGWFTARLHLWIFDKIFLRRGSIETFRRQP